MLYREVLYPEPDERVVGPRLTWGKTRRPFLKNN
jgi:hypothetical protein